MTRPGANPSFSRRRRALTLSLGACGLLASAAASAVPAQGAAYSGTLTGVPEGEIHLTFERENGHLYLDQYRWGQAPQQCDNGTESLGSQGGYNPPEGLVSHRRFRVRRTAPQNDYISLMRGTFNKKRTKLTGALRYRGQSSDPSLGVCDTGLVEWKAFKEV